MVLGSILTQLGHWDGISYFLPWAGEDAFQGSTVNLDTCLKHGFCEASGSGKFKDGQGFGLRDLVLKLAV